MADYGVYIYSSVLIVLALLSWQSWQAYRAFKRTEKQIRDNLNER
jgi:hypothetical protein